MTMWRICTSNVSRGSGEIVSDVLHYIRSVATGGEFERMLAIYHKALTLSGSTVNGSKERCQRIGNLP